MDVFYNRELIQDQVQLHLCYDHDHVQAFNKWSADIDLVKTVLGLFYLINYF